MDKLIVCSRGRQGPIKGKSLLFMIHLLESGADLRYIQEILENKDSNTTESYTQVMHKNLARIISPLDRLLRKKSWLG